jgi:hypothetical protein
MSNNNKRQAIYFMDFKGVQSGTIDAYIGGDTDTRRTLRSKCKDVVWKNPREREIPDLIRESLGRHGTNTDANGRTLPRLHIVVITLDGGTSGDPVVTHVTTKAKWKPSNGTVEILSLKTMRETIIEASRIPIMRDLTLWCGASRDPETAWPHHVIFMLTDPVRQQHRDLIKNLPLMHGDDREAWFFKVSITRANSLCINKSIVRVLTGGATIQSMYHGNTAFRNAARRLLNSGTSTTRHVEHQPNHLRKRTKPTKLSNSIARHLYRATLTHNNTKYRYLFYPPGIKDLDRVIQTAKALRLEPMMYDIDRTGGYMVVRHGKNTMVLLPRRTDNTRPFPPNTVPLLVDPLA